MAILALSNAAAGSVITPSEGSAEGTAGYTWHVTLDPMANDGTTLSGTVGTWSWEDSSLDLGDGIGWRHQSDWLAVTLTRSGVLEISATRADEVTDARFFPSFSLYENHTDVTSQHAFENRADLSWDDDLKLVAFVENSERSEASLSLALPAGEYTIVLGGNGKSEDLPENVNYLLSLTTVPEPSTLCLGALGALVLTARRRR